MTIINGFETTITINNKSYKLTFNSTENGYIYNYKGLLINIFNNTITTRYKNYIEARNISSNISHQVEKSICKFLDWKSLYTIKHEGVVK